MSATTAQALKGLCGSLIGICTIVVGLRFFSRFRQKAQFKLDDWFMLAALAFLIGTATTTLVGVHHRILGYPPTLDPVKARGALKFSNLLYLCFDILSTATVGFIKLSALLFYKRIFCPHWSGLTITIYVFTAIVTLYTILFMIILPTQCGLDLSVLWAPDPQLSKARCNSGHSVARVEAWVICDAILDAIIIAMPLPSIWKLKTTVRRKIAVSVVFLTAFVGLGASIARVVIFMQSLTDETKIKDNKLKDGNLATEALLMFYTILSAGMCLVAVNLPSIWFLFTSGKIPEKILESIRSLVSLSSSLGARNGDRGSSTSSKKKSGGSLHDPPGAQVHGNGNGNGKIDWEMHPEAEEWELHVLPEPGLKTKKDLESGNNGDGVAASAV